MRPRRPVLLLLPVLRLWVVLGRLLVAVVSAALPLASPGAARSPLWICRLQNHSPRPENLFLRSPGSRRRRPKLPGHRPGTYVATAGVNTAPVPITGYSYRTGPKWGREHRWYHLYAVLRIQIYLFPVWLRLRCFRKF